MPMHDGIYEVSAERDEGFRFSAQLSKAEPWRGWRVKYRRSGTRTWSSFVFDHPGQPTANELQRACELHERNT